MQRRRPNGRGPGGAILAPDASAALRDQLLGELGNLKAADDAAAWVHKALARKSTLTDSDARDVERAFALHMTELGVDENPPLADAAPLSSTPAAITGSNDFGAATGANTKNTGSLASALQHT